MDSRIVTGGLAFAAATAYTAWTAGNTKHAIGSGSDADVLAHAGSAVVPAALGLTSGLLGAQGLFITREGTRSVGAWNAVGRHGGPVGYSAMAGGAAGLGIATFVG